MASVTVTGVTDTTASIEITGLNTYWFQKRFTFYWGEISYSNSDTKTSAIPESGTYSYTYTGLSPNTSYIFGVYIESMQGGTYYYEEEVDGSFSTTGGGGGGGSWSLYERNIGSISSETSRFESGLSANTLYRYSMYFTSATSVTFNSSGYADTVAWLSDYTQTSWNDSNGSPYNYVAYNDEGGSAHNFKITYTCNANTTYYLWFRTYTGGSYSDAVGITITPSGGGGGGNGYVYIYTGSAWVRAKPYIYTGSAWVPATPYIYTGSTWKPTT